MNGLRSSIRGANGISLVPRVDVDVVVRKDASPPHRFADCTNRGYIRPDGCRTHPSQHNTNNNSPSLLSDQKRCVHWTTVGGDKNIFYILGVGVLGDNSYLSLSSFTLYADDNDPRAR